MGKLIDLTGEKFGRLLVTTRAGSDKKGNARWLCLCDCGEEKVVGSDSLREGSTKSCGCHRRDIARAMGQSRRKYFDDSSRLLYMVWSNMIGRCYNENRKDYKFYGGKGIEVCGEWRNSSLTFIAWATGKWEKGLQIDRRRNTGDYSPENCRFVSPVINYHNKDNLRADNTSGYTGVYRYLRGTDLTKWASRVYSGGTRISLGYFPSRNLAVTARNNYIIKHKLPHKLQEIKE